jgi:hypothetical protein
MRGVREVPRTARPPVGTASSSRASGEKVLFSALKLSRDARILSRRALLLTVFTGFDRALVGEELDRALVGEELFSLRVLLFDFVLAFVDLFVVAVFFAFVLVARFATLAIGIAREATRRKPRKWEREVRTSCRRTAARRTSKTHTSPLAVTVQNLLQRAQRGNEKLTCN